MRVRGWCAAILIVLGAGILASQESRDPHALVRRLRESKDEQVWMRAYLDLRKAGPGSAVDDVMGLLTETNPRVQVLGLRLLGLWSVKRAESAITIALNDPEPLVREAAADALGQLPALEAGPSLIRRLDDPEIAVRNRAAVALGRMNYTKATTTIADRHRTKSIHPAAAAEALLLMDPPGPKDVLLEILDDMARIPRSMVGRCVIDLDSLDRPEPLDFMGLGALLCKRGPVEVAVELFRRSGEHAFGNSLVQGLHGSRNRELAKALDQANLLKNEYALNAALNAMVSMNGGDVPAFLSIVSKYPPARRTVATWGSGPLRLFPDEAAAFADNSSPNVRRAVVQALSQDRSGKHIDQLRKFGSDPDPDVRTELAWSLRNMVTPDLDATVGALIKDSDPYVRVSAAQAVSSLGLSQYAPDIAAIVADEKDPHRESAMYELVRLKARKHASSIYSMLRKPETAHHAAKALSDLGAQEAVPELLELARSGCIEAKAQAIRSIALLGSADQIPDLDVLAKSSEDALRAAAVFALGCFKDRIAQLAAGLKDPSHAVKGEAIQALLKLQSREHLQDILALTDLGFPVDSPEWRREYEEKRAWASVIPAVDAVGQLGNAEAAKSLARLLKKGMNGYFGERVASALLALDSRTHLKLVLEMAPWINPSTVLYQLNRLAAPSLFERVGSRQVTSWRGPHEYGPLKQQAAFLEESLGVPILVDPSIPAEVRDRPGFIGRIYLEPHQNLVSILQQSWPECAYIMDEKENRIRIITVEYAKSYWLRWAESEK